MRWLGETVICVASGPSLTQHDCDAAEASGHRIMAVNTSWSMVPRCDAIFACDHDWWTKHIELIASRAERWTNCPTSAKKFGLHLTRAGQSLHSGLAAVYLAELFGAARILLLGYDCQPGKDGEAHWHGRHDGNNPNEISYRIWQKQYRMVNRGLRAKVVNCSRETAIAVFPRDTLESQLLIGGLDAVRNGSEGQ